MDISMIEPILLKIIALGVSRAHRGTVMDAQCIIIVIIFIHNNSHFN